MCESEPIFKDHELAIFKQYMKIRGDLFDAMGMTRNIVLLKKLQKALHLTLNQIQIKLKPPTLKAKMTIILLGVKSSLKKSLLLVKDLYCKEELLINHRVL